jgi:hypothetical protein
VARRAKLPPGAFGFFLASQAQADVIGVPGSQGRLGFGGSIGRFVGPGQVQSAAAAGMINLALYLAAFPNPALGLVAVQPGKTWSFQAWHRDSGPMGTATSNFTEAVSVGF